ncbi:PAS domain S-box protein [Myxococcus sp. CA051A]|uniref:ATP-binding protein n=1 Tax=Myxococcus sp. CA051A TaxID=2741739 RepID=UPI00157AE1EB|nr:ATP-binding protein [Myxococcus sp. CA051A]NTX65075.1 PAS domain S-box protein [Myxococcus sp. CA051A]
MMRRWTFAQRVGAGVSACMLAGLLLLVTLLSAVHGLLTHTETTHVALRQALLAGCVGLAGVGALGFVLHHALAPLHARHEHSEQRLRLLMEAVTDYALCFLDPNGRVTAWNAGAERLTGWAEMDVTGGTLEPLHPEDAVAAGVHQAHLERAAREGRLLSEGWRVRRDGSRFWAETLLTALWDSRGHLRGFAEVTRDITERRRMERAQALFAEAGRVLQPLSGAREVGEALTRLCVPEVADACILFLPSADGQVRPQAVACADTQAASRMWEPLLRSPHGDEVGPHHVVCTGRVELLPEVDAERLPQPLEGTAHGELLRVLGVTSSLTVPLAVGPRVLGALCLLSTGARRYGQVDRAFMEELAARAALALDNARLLAETQGALELIGVAAHDLGNPLSSLQLRLRRLRLLDVTAHEPRLRDGLLGVESEARRMGRLLHNLLDLSRLSAGHMTLDREDMDLAALVREVAERHAEQATAAGCALTVRIHEDDTSGQWDRLRLDRVVTNLLSNALKFGHGQPIDLSVHGDATHVRVTVKDAGLGIAPGDQQRLFRRFERVHGDGGPHHPGTGLGLYIAHQLVEAHGGSILLRSRIGEGAEFTIELPRTLQGRSCLPLQVSA